MGDRFFSTFVDAATLSRHLDHPDWRICDVRHQLSDVSAGERAYAEAHLPGAVFFHLDRDLSGAMTGQNGRHPLPDPVRLAGKLGDVGIGPKTQVVVYDDGSGMIAGRLWWLLRWLGHDHVALLDGGYAAWVRQGGQLSSDVPVVAPCTFATALRPKLCVGVASVERNLTAPGFLVVDARGEDRFRGENEALDPVGGHIPGAVNRCFKDNLGPNGLLKPVDQLKQEFIRLFGTWRADQVVHQCGSGVSACFNMVSMEHAGLTGSRLYAGSWSEWCTPQAGRPVETSSVA